jgi:hypothetical protein
LHEKAQSNFSYFLALVRRTNQPIGETTLSKPLSFALIALSVHDARLEHGNPASRQTKPGIVAEDHSPTTYSPWGRLQKKRCWMAGKQ